jgi:hypothetical protein
MNREEVHRATLMIARSALLQVKPRAFGNAECGDGA